jgi:excisionase family DNA binding protein
MNSKAKEIKTHFTPAEVATLFGVAAVTVRVWANKGWLKAELTAGGHRRFSKQELFRFARERNMTLFQDALDTLKILIVDDDEDFVGFLKEFFSCLPLPPDIEVAYDGFSAGLKVLNFQPDIVMLDLMMPNIDGFAVCEAIKKDPVTRAVRVIAMTGYPTRERVTRILSLGAEACLPKPISTADLLETLGMEDKRV